MKKKVTKQPAPQGEVTTPQPVAAAWRRCAPITGEIPCTVPLRRLC